jgi:hypothetical protein
VFTNKTKKINLRARPRTLENNESKGIEIKRMSAEVNKRRRSGALPVQRWEKSTP